MKNKVNTKWDLTIFYKSPEDPQIEKDIVEIEKIYDDFDKKYRKNSVYTKNADELKKSLIDFQKIIELSSAAKPLIYFHYIKCLDAKNTKADAEISRIINRLTHADNKIIFYQLALGKISSKNQSDFLLSPKLKSFRYFLSKTFETAKYNLTEAEEKIMSLKSLPSHSLWVDGADKLLNQQSVVFKKKTMPIPEAMGMIASLSVKDRRDLSKIIMNKLKSISHFAESEINAIYTDKKINDDLRGFKEPYDSTILSYQNSREMVINLVETTTKYFSISNKFYTLKSKLLKLPYLKYADRGVSIGKEKKVKFEDGLQILKDSFAKVSPKYLEILERYLENGQVDVFPAQGKRGGAFCSSGVGTPTLVLLNHMPNYDGVMTFAHEMGHAIHAEFSKSQSPLYQGHSTAVAEVASTFFENLAFEEIFSKLTDKEKIEALHDRINDDISTVFRQIACFNFEYELHTQIKQKGALSREDIAALMNKHMSAYLGKSVKLDEVDGYFFVAWSHIRSFFYVYSYAYGQLISKALYASYKKDKNFLLKIEEFLYAGESKTPEDIFNSIGIDTTKPEFFELALQSIEKDIDYLEELAKSKKLI